MRIAGLFVYPVKSCQGLAVEEAALRPHGLALDRTFAFVDEAGRVLSQKREPRLARIAVRLAGGGLELASPGRAPLLVDPDDPGVDAVEVSIHEQRMRVLRHRDPAIRAWITALLGQPAALVRHDPAARRLIARPRPGAHNETVLSDACPLSVIGSRSLDVIHERLRERGQPPVPMDRFRPSVVVEGLEPFAEDALGALRAGSVTLLPVAPIERCVMIQTDQRTGARGPEPMRTLAAFRAAYGRVFVGRYFAHRGEGVLRVGMPLEHDDAAAQASA